MLVCITCFKSIPIQKSPIKSGIKTNQSRLKSHWACQFKKAPSNRGLRRFVAAAFSPLYQFKKAPSNRGLRPKLFDIHDALTFKFKKAPSNRGLRLVRLFNLFCLCEFKKAPSNRGLRHYSFFRCTSSQSNSKKPHQIGD